jgi:hypothetical protein
MSDIKTTKASALANLQALIAGTQKHPATGSFQVDGATYTSVSIVQLFQGLVAAMTAYAIASASAKDALLQERAVSAAVGPVLTGYRAYLRLTLGKQTQLLADYGLSPTKAKKPLSVEAKAAAVARSESTRKARGTKGPKARLAITAPAVVGEVPAEAASAGIAVSKPKA